MITDMSAERYVSSTRARRYSSKALIFADFNDMFGDIEWMDVDRVR